MSFVGFFKQLWDDLQNPFDVFPVSFRSTITNQENGITKKGATLLMAANVAEDDPNPNNEPAPPITWEVDDITVATINAQTGLLQAVGNGTVTVTASLGAYSTSGTHELTLRNQGKFTIVITGEEAITTPNGELDLIAVVQEDGVDRPDLSEYITWHVLDGASVAITVDDNAGKITVQAQSNGTSKLEARFENEDILDGTIRKEHKVEASYNGDFDIVINGSNEVTAQNRTLELTAEIKEDNAVRELGDLTIEWEVLEGDDLIQINRNNETLTITGTASGTVEIQASIGGIEGLKGTTNITKQIRIPTVFRARITAGRRTIKEKNGTLQLAAVVEETENNGANDAPPVVVWSVDNTDVAIIDANSGLLTAQSNGEVEITASLGSDYHQSTTVLAEVTCQGVFTLEIEGDDTIDTNGDVKTLTAVLKEDGNPYPLGNEVVNWNIEEGEEWITYVAKNNNLIDITAVNNGTTKIKASLASRNLTSDSHEITITNQVVQVTNFNVYGGQNATQLLVGRTYVLNIEFDKPWINPNKPTIENLDTNGIKVLQRKLSKDKKTFRVQYKIEKGGLDVTLSCLGQNLNIQSLDLLTEVYREQVFEEEEVNGLKYFGKLSAEHLAFEVLNVSRTTNEKVSLTVYIAEDLIELTSVEWSSNLKEHCALQKVVQEGLYSHADFLIKSPDQSIVITASVKYHGEVFSVTTTFDVGKKNQSGNTEYEISNIVKPVPALNQVVEFDKYPLLMEVAVTPVGAGAVRTITCPVFKQAKGSTVREILVDVLGLESADNISTLQVNQVIGGYADLDDNDRVGTVAGLTDEKRFTARASIEKGYFYAKAPDPSLVNSQNFADYDRLNGELLLIVVQPNKLDRTWGDLITGDTELIRALGKSSARVFELHEIPVPDDYGEYSYTFISDGQEIILNVLIRKPSGNLGGGNEWEIAEQELLELVQDNATGQGRITDSGMVKATKKAIKGEINSGPSGHYHCSSWFKEKKTGCTLFFDALPADADSLVAIGHHDPVTYKKGNKKVDYTIHWIKGGYNGSIKTGPKGVTL